MPPREHPFWQADDCAENVISTVMELEAQLGDAERIVTEQEARLFSARLAREVAR